MTQQTTIDMLRAMRMSAMAAEFEKQMGDPAFRELGFEDRLGLLVNAEWNRRQSNKVERLIRTARFSAPFACVEEIEYHEDRHLDRAEMLRLSTWWTRDVTSSSRALPATERPTSPVRWEPPPVAASRRCAT